MDAVEEIAKRHNLFVIEDACQAVGGKYKDKYLGAIGDAGAFSFNYFKIASCGEGGGFLTNNKDAFERALIYHDSSAIAFFGDQLEGVSTPNFCGQEFRSNEICAAVLNIQLDRLDGILTDLRKNKKYLMEKLSDVATFIPSNDIEGDCGTTLAFSFDSADKAWNFAYAEGIRGTIPIRTGKHVYRNWDCIMKKRGAFNPLMDPFGMEANKGIIPDYREDMCPETLDKLSKAVYMSVNPDATKEGDTRSNLGRQVAEEVSKFFGSTIFSTTIPRNIRLAESPSYGQPIYLYDKTCVGSIAYLKLVEEYFDRNNIEYKKLTRKKEFKKK